MKIRVPIFREGSFPQLKAKLGIERADRAFLEKVADGTRVMMERTKWRPRIKGGHGAGKDVLGWIETPPSVNGRMLEAVLEFNDDGAKLIKSKKARYLSSEIDHDVSIYGDDDSDRVPFRIRAVALLSSEDPQLRDLTDLAEESAHFSVAEKSGVVVYFSEINFEEEENTEEDMKEEEKKKQEAEDAKKKAADEAAAKKKQEDDDAAKKAADEKAAKEKADEKPAATLDSLAASVAGLAKTVSGLVETVTKLADPSTAAAAVAAHAEVAQFSEVAKTKLSPTLATAAISAFTAGDAATRAKMKKELLLQGGEFAGFSEGDGGDFSEGDGITSADFAESATNLKIGAKVDKAFRAAQSKDPKLTFDAFRNSVINRPS